MKKNIFLLFLFLSIVACNSGGDFSKELSGNYFYREESSEIKQILPHIPNPSAPNADAIYSTVVDYDYNKDFIIALQRPNFEDYKSMIAFYLRDSISLSTKGKDVILQSEKEADSILRNTPRYVKIFSQKTNFWIIDNKAKRLYGPLTQSEYLEKRKELGIPEHLKIKLN